jgi:hypothetical protein
MYFVIVCELALENLKMSSSCDNDKVLVETNIISSLCMLKTVFQVELYIFLLS